MNTTVERRPTLSPLGSVAVRTSSTAHLIEPHCRHRTVESGTKIAPNHAADQRTLVHLCG